MRRSSNGSSKPYQPSPTRRASFNGGFEADLQALLQNDNTILEQQQIQTNVKKSPRKLTLNNSILPTTISKLPINGSVSPSPMNNPTILNTTNLGPATLNGVQEQQHANLPSNLYKTELCRSFEETGTCRYGSKCQFAHGDAELRPAPRHPKYKTEICKTFHSIGTCPYGTRCRFIHTSPSDNIDWITADVDNPLFDLNDKNAPEFDRSPNTIPNVPAYQSFNARLPPIPNRFHHQFPINNNEPLLSVIRAEIPPRLDPTHRLESRIVERPSTASTIPSITPTATSAPSNTTTNTISTVNLNTLTTIAVNTSTSTSNTITTPIIPAANNITLNVGKPSPVISGITVNNASMSTPGHKHRLPVFRELCHQNSVERLQQQVLDFVFEKEQ